jgi:CYTH domain-containing protein
MCLKRLLVDNDSWAQSVSHKVTTHHQYISGKLVEVKGNHAAGVVRLLTFGLEACIGEI